MQVILLERIEKLGQMGDVVAVKDGFARNYLLPQQKALRANEANRAYFETRRVELEARNLERKNEAEAVAQKLDGHYVVLVRQAGETGQLYGSASARDIAEQLGEDGFRVERGQVNMDRPIKTLGLHEVRLSLHPEVEIAVLVNVARSLDEAEIQQQSGMAVTDMAEEEEASEEELALEAAQEMFEDPEAAQEAIEETAEAIGDVAAGDEADAASESDEEKPAE